MVRGPEDRAALKVRRGIFFASFVAVAAFAIAYGFGAMKSNAVSDYVVFVLLGSLASVLTWGILSSSGEISGSPYGVNVKLAGAIVPFVTIAGGGVWLRLKDQELQQEAAELQRKQQQNENQRQVDVNFRFVNGQGDPVPLMGTARLIVGTDVRAEALKNTDLVTFSHLPREALDAGTTLVLLASGFRMLDPNDLRLEPGQTIPVRVRPTTTISGTILLDGVPLLGAAVSVAGSRCKTELDTDKDGYFQIACDSVNLPGTLLLHPPEAVASRACNREIPLKQLEQNIFRLSGCGAPEAAPPVIATSAPGLPCGKGSAQSALRQVVKSFSLDTQVTVTATLQDTGMFKDVQVTGGPADLAGKIAAKQADAINYPCKPDKATVTVSATK